MTTPSTTPTIDGEALMQTVDKALVAVVGVDIAEAEDIMVDTIHTPDRGSHGNYPHPQPNNTQRNQQPHLSRFGTQC